MTLSDLLKGQFGDLLSLLLLLCVGYAAYAQSVSDS